MGIDLHDYQTTIKSRVTLVGHRRPQRQAGFDPFPPGRSRYRHRLPLPGDGCGVDDEFRALVSEVGATDLCTVLGDPAGHHVATVEHVMAASSALGIDNLVDRDRRQRNADPGRQRRTLRRGDRPGRHRDARRQAPLHPRHKPVRIESGASWAEFRPYDGTRFEVEIDFESPAIGRQSFAADIDADMFRREIARARTFGFMKDVERLWAAGYALGSSLENSVVIGDDSRVINMEGLRYQDEFVRHKMLDAMGDLALAGARFIGCFRSYRGGHRLNAAALRRLLSDRSAFEIVETSTPRARPFGRTDRGQRAGLRALGALRPRAPAGTRSLATFEQSRQTDRLRQPLPQKCAIAGR